MRGRFPPEEAAPERTGRLLIALTLAGVLAAGCATAERPDRSGTGSATPAASAAGAPTGRGPVLPSPADRPPAADRYQPLWPFTDQDQARAWQRSYRTGGHQPWHLDAAQTALGFAQGYLGFEHIDRVIASTVEGADARVTVGFAAEESDRPLAAAVIHLVRFGTEADAPWEVVGTDDAALSLTAPRYGSRVTSPLTVAGRITGVDESIRVQVRQPWSARVLGEHCCVPAGGENRSWSARVTFRARPGQTITIVAATGGHVAEIERFAVTGVRPAD